ncbi:Arginyl-tRNA synthetase [Tribonema minus]|uniref:arginine--tRNA ligase n=1 Tax=Tribonema minus TaxID=303371 RepID=A0A835ZBM0_9STRA|nr:Arginyl-tRNA synthetase [Tribonema minus]
MPLRRTVHRLSQQRRSATTSLASAATSSPPDTARPTQGDDGGRPKDYIEAAVRQALVKAFGEAGAAAAPMVTAATKPEFGDYQCNAAMALAKPLNAKPRDIAQQLIDALEVADLCDPPDIAGPGFINLRLKPEYIQSRITAMLEDESRLAIAKTTAPQRIVVDFSSPNIAKEMHVGHLRSTIIGDTLCRVLEFQGHDVLRLNHVGDWGTQFGMLITYLKEEVPQALADGDGGEGSITAGEVDIGDLVEFYKKAKERFDGDASFKERSRAEVVRLQAGDPDVLRAWRLLCDLSRREFQVIYDILGVKLEERGESFYNSMLGGVIEELREGGLLQESEGAQVVFIEGAKNRDDSAQALIVQKTDGGYMYSTTDLAAVKQRATQERADRVLYVTDSGQASHFDQVFQVARRSGLAPPSLQLQHVPFGLVQGEDGKKFKTRSGDTVKLKDLLDEAVRIAAEDMEKRLAEEGRGMGEEERAVARKVGLGAVKYADLSMNRESNYRFSYAKMLSLQGNTAPYMMYAYARIQGIRRRATTSTPISTSDPPRIVLEHPAELTLARTLLRLPEVLTELERDLYPNRLCEYLFDLSQRFNQFYEGCPVNAAATDELRASRVALCSVTAATIKLSLGLLGIDVVEKL